jgi:anthranilate/para-aminobenzoate synthase component I
MHIVSHVQGNLRKDEDVFSALEAVFPGGTITGCPKIRCMEILDGIEPVARGPFFGSAGWIGYQGDGEMNLLIRTAVIKGEGSDKKIYIQAGSGIVADSNPEREYEESMHKAGALLEALKNSQG